MKEKTSSRCRLCGRARLSAPPDPTLPNFERSPLRVSCMAGAVEVRSDSAAETSPDGKSPPTIDAPDPVRPAESSSQRLSQQQQRIQHVGNNNVHVEEKEDGLGGGDWGHGTAQEEERGRSEEAEVGGRQDERGEEQERQVPSESISRGLFSFPWLSGRTEEPEPEPEPERPDTPMVSRLKSGAFGTQNTTHSDYAGEWRGAGGLFGLSADWREAILSPDQGAGGASGRHMSLRGEACMTEEKRAEVQAILEKRRTGGASKQNVRGKRDGTG